MKQLLITIAAVLLVGCGERLKEVSFHQASINGDEDTIKKNWQMVLMKETKIML